MDQADPSELVERTTELECIEQMLASATAGAGTMMFIVGEAGIGKTGLVRAAGRSAAGHGMRVLAGRGGELEQGLAFGVVRDLLAPYPRRLHDGSDALAGAAALAASVLSPTIEPGPVIAADAHTTLHGLYWFTAGLAATAPTLLTVDDAHWCDAPTLRFLTYLARRLDGLQIALLVATRPSVDAAQSELLRVLAGEAQPEVIRPRPLSRQAVHTIVAAGLGHAPDVEFADACSTATGGNPFLVREMVAELRAAEVTPTRANVDRVDDAAPHGVRQAILTRLAQLPTGCTALARATAVLGDGVDRRQAARLAGLTDQQAGPLVDALAMARIIEPHVTLTFVHPLVRATVVNSLGPVELAAAHWRAAGLMFDNHLPSDRIVSHLLAAEGHGEPWVVNALQNAACRAVARGAPEVAAQYLRRALDEPPPIADRAELLLDLGTAEMHAGHTAAFEHLAAATEHSTEPEVRARASLALARALFMAGRMVDSVDVSLEAIDDLDGRDPTLALELEVELIGAARQDIATRALALRRMAQRTIDPEPSGPAECMMLANLAIEEAAALGSRDQVIDLAERALTNGWLFDTRALVTLPLVMYTFNLAGHARRSLEICDRAIANHRARGEVQGYAVASAFRSYTLHQLGDVTEAVADGRAAMELAAAHSVPLIQGHAAAWLALALVDAGDLESAEQVIASQAEALNSAQFVANRLLSARGHLRLAQGRPNDAIVDLLQCGRGLAAWDTKNPWMCPWLPQHALALHSRGDHEEAALVATTAIDTALSWGAPHTIVEALRVAALTEPDGPTREQKLRHATSTAEADGSPLEHARTLFSLGSTIRRSGRRTEARTPLRSALDQALRCGAHGLARLAHDELVASGAQPRRLRSTGVHALTPTERRIADMAAPGLTNREIAQALFVAEKTVETHLGSVYRKLGISSRSQLQNALGTGSEQRT